MMCPAEILAASRNDRVIGRIVDLKDSTDDKKFISNVGVFSGTRWDLSIMMLVMITMITIDNHNGSDIESVSIRWDVGE